LKGVSAAELAAQVPAAGRHKPEPVVVGGFSKYHYIRALLLPAGVNSRPY
jgi:hypothetical protein